MLKNVDANIGKIIRNRAEAELARHEREVMKMQAH